jgi:geranylgeranyl pyrophosphate synthase
MAPRDAVAIASAVELLHNASLVHDDLQDGETERRGLPTVARVYGDSIALCVGDLCLSSAYAALAQFENPSLVPKLLKLMHKRTAAVIRGQCAEFATGDAISQVTDYVKIVREKSGVLLSLPLELALLGSGRAEWLGNARSAAENFGIAYQIVDDIQDYERDSANDRARPCLNILDVLMRGGHSENSIRVATECAMWHFDLCARDAASLPHGSGNNLLALIESLRNQL